LQESVTQEFGTVFKLAIDDEVHRTPKQGAGSGSTDVGDISWRIPTGGCGRPAFALRSPGHSWQNVAAIGSTIGEKGFTMPPKCWLCTRSIYWKTRKRSPAKLDFANRMENRKYVTLIPPAKQPPNRFA